MSPPTTDPNVLLRERPEIGPVMRVLMGTGRYEEGEDAFEWLVNEAADTFDLIEQYGPDCECPEAVLYETGFWTEDDGPFPDDLRSRLVEAATTGSKDARGT